MTPLPIRVIRYRTLASCLASFHNCRPSELPRRGAWEWYDRDGRKVRKSVARATRYCRERGCWGWVSNHKTLHLWISSKAQFSEIIGLIAHELGHCEKPCGHGAREEKKAARYERVAEGAVKLAALLPKIPWAKMPVLPT